MTPLVSVLMTSYNRDNYIGEAIESVLASTYANFELIIVDDMSSDDTVAIAKSYMRMDSRVRVYENDTNLGDYLNRNRAASYAEGKYIKYVDSDDLIYPESLGIMVSAMERYPSAAVGIQGRNVQENVPYPVYLTSPEAYRMHFFNNGIFDTGPTALIFNHAAFKEGGGFSGKRFIGDTDINLRLSARAGVVVLPSSLVYWRKHDGQEFNVGNLGTSYMEYTMAMLNDLLNREECPLSKDEVQRILKYYRGIYGRKILKHLFMSKAPVDTYRLFRKMSLSFTDLIRSFVKPGKLQ